MFYAVFPSSRLEAVAHGCGQRDLVHKSRTKMQSTRRIALTATRTVGKSSHRTVGSVIAPKFVFQITQARLFRSSALAFSNVTQNSWAADRLTELGEALPAGKPIPPTQLSEEALYNPPEKILKLADELLACNMVESNQVWRIIQVLLIMLHYPILFFSIFSFQLIPSTDTPRSDPRRSVFRGWRWRWRWRRCWRR